MSEIECCHREYCPEHKELETELASLREARETAELYASQLLAKLEKERELLRRMQTRMELINGPESECCKRDPNTCANHSLINEASVLLSDFEAKA